MLVHQEDDERFWMGVSASRDERWLLLGLGSKTTSEVHVLDADDPEGAWRVLAPRREGVEYDVEPAADRFLIVHNTDTPDADLAWAPVRRDEPRAVGALARARARASGSSASTRSTTRPC